MTLLDKNGCPFEVRKCETGDSVCLIEMYDHFTPKGAFQGMPPRDKNSSDKWIQDMLKKGINFLAWRSGKVIGHVAIFPDFDRKNAEYLIFVSLAARGSGVGKELTRRILRCAGELGLKTVWLTVDSFNFRATRLYKKIGFKFCETYSSASERMMVLKLED
jgi:RimJ/RimL family protein N-acetyltransferase